MTLSIEEIYILIDVLRTYCKDYYNRNPCEILDAPEAELCAKLVLEYKERKKRIIEK